MAFDNDISSYTQSNQCHYRGVAYWIPLLLMFPVAYAVPDCDVLSPFCTVDFCLHLKS